YVGLKRDQIDTAVVGLQTNTFPPKVRVVVRTRSSYDAAVLREKLGATRSKTVGAKTVDLIKPPGQPFDGMLWCATARTFVITLGGEDEMSRVPDEPAKGVDRLAPALAELLKERSDRDTFLWLVAHSDNWEKATAPLVLLAPKMITAEDQKKLTKFR